MRNRSSNRPLAASGEPSNTSARQSATAGELSNTSARPSAAGGGRRPSGPRPLASRLLILYIPVLILVTGFILLDTFVLPDAQQVVAAASSDSNSSTASGSASAGESEDSGFVPDDETTAASQDTADEAQTDAQSTEQNDSGDAVITDNSYQDENIQIKLTETRVNDTNVYIADVQVSDASYLKTAFAQSTFGRNIKATTSETAEENNAILAINGDYYGFRNYGYVLRNGELYRSNGNGSEDLVIDADGGFSIINEDEVSAESLLEDGAQQVLSFGPALIEDGQISVTANSEVAQSTNSNPRTAIGVISPLHYVFVVSDGRNDESEGLTLLELAQVLQDQGCTTAYNLDGGGSSTMVFNGQVVNNPSGGRGGHGSSERSVSDIIFIG